MQTTFNIENLMCDGCVKTATDGVRSVDGVSEVAVSLEKKSITFNSENDNIINLVKDKLIELGYPETQEISLLDKAKSYLNK